MLDMAQTEMEKDTVHGKATHVHAHRQTFTMMSCFREEYFAYWIAGQRVACSFESLLHFD